MRTRWGKREERRRIIPNWQQDAMSSNWRSHLCARVWACAQVQQQCQSLGHADTELLCLCLSDAAFASASSQLTQLRDSPFLLLRTLCRKDSPAFCVNPSVRCRDILPEKWNILSAGDDKKTEVNVPPRLLAFIYPIVGSVWTQVNNEMKLHICTRRTHASYDVISHIPFSAHCHNKAWHLNKGLFTRLLPGRTVVLFLQLAFLYKRYKGIIRELAGKEVEHRIAIYKVGLAKSRFVLLDLCKTVSLLLITSPHNNGTLRQTSCNILLFSTS